jgi:hypothetical protein
VTVPGTARGWEATVERFGRRSLADALAPAIRYATGDCPACEVVATQWERGEALFTGVHAVRAVERTAPGHHVTLVTRGDHGHPECTSAGNWTGSTGSTGSGTSTSSSVAAGATSPECSSERVRSASVRSATATHPHTDAVGASTQSVRIPVSGAGRPPDPWGT